MTPETADDALALAEAHGISPVVTHSALRALRDVEGAWSDAQFLRLYRLGGVFSFGLSGLLLDPVNPTAAVPDDFCPGTLEAWQLHYQAAVALLVADGQAPVVGWSSDWNGWLSHSRPAYGARACRPLDTLSDPLPIDTLGLAHPGLLPDHWTRLERRGVDLAPARSSAEAFLRLWEAARSGGADPTSGTVPTGRTP